MTILGIIASAIRKAISDTFNRADTASGLGTSSGGSVWQILRGGWKITSNKAVATSAASQYSLAAMELNSKNATVQLGEVSNGVGPAFWITDSNNWHAARSTATSSSYSYCCGGSTCSCGTSQYCCGGPCDCGTSKSCCSPCSCGSSTACCSPCTCPKVCTGCGSYTEYYYYCAYSGFTGFGTSNFQQFSGSYESSTDDTCGIGCPGCSVDANGSAFCVECSQMTRYIPRTDCDCPASTSCCTSPCACPDSTDCCSSPCNCGSSYGCCGNCSCGSDCCCGTCTGTSYSYYLGIIKMSGGAVSSVGSDVALSAAAASIRVVTSGSNVTAYGYQGTDFSTLLNSVTAPSTPGGTMHGVVHSSSSYNQGTTADGFQASSQ